MPFSDRALNVRCPRCRATRFSPCTNAKGEEREPHDARLRKAGIPVDRPKPTPDFIKPGRGRRPDKPPEKPQAVETGFTCFCGEPSVAVDTWFHWYPCKRHRHLNPNEYQEARAAFREKAKQDA